MGGGRKSKPRVRSTRPIGLSSEGAPSKPNDPPVGQDGMWFIPEPVSMRLFQKSALGIICEGGILLTDEEVMFCHWHRHIPLQDDFVDNRLEEDPDFAHRCVAFDVARSGGEKVVPRDGVWLRWARDTHPSKGTPEAEIRWARTSNSLDWSELLQWTRTVTDSGMLSELAIVDDEMDVTMYRLSLIDPRGSLTPAIPGEESDSIGVEHLSRRFIREDEANWAAGNDDDVTKLFDELNSRGLLMRPGFKYGCRWRVYDTPIDESHAPWLMQMQKDAANTWDGVCLSVRLAEGVNKGWVCVMNDGNWNFLQFRRHLPGR